MTSEHEHKPKLSLHRMVPNMLTISAICAGMTSMQFAMAGKWEHAVVAIVVAAFIDGFDGAAARLLKATSKLGAELDSLSDFLCFGAAPAIVLHLWGLHDAGRVGWITALVFSVAVALRLARFNVMNDEKPAEELANPMKGYFMGIPAPAGAGMVLLPMIISFQLEEAGLGFSGGSAFLIAWTLLIAGLMVSRVPTFSSKQIRLPHKLVVPALAAFGLMAAALINEPWPTLSLMGVAYALSIPCSILHHARKKRAGG